jgi:DNA-binding LytR/AlgR family response regulator
VVKPIEYFSFEVKMDRAIKRLNDKKQVELLIKTSDGVIKLTAAQLIYVEVVKHNVIYHTRDREYVSYSSLKEVEIMLQENGFSRCNNCYLVNLMHITHIDENNLYLDELSSPLAISRTRRKALIEDWTECVKRNNR